MPSMCKELHFHIHDSTSLTISLQVKKVVLVVEDFVHTYFALPERQMYSFMRCYRAHWLLLFSQKTTKKLCQQRIQKEKSENRKQRNCLSTTTRGFATLVSSFLLTWKALVHVHRAACM
jgi:hypothetical protein